VKNGLPQKYLQTKGFRLKAGGFLSNVLERIWLYDRVSSLRKKYFFSLKLFTSPRVQTVILTKMIKKVQKFWNA